MELKLETTVLGCRPLVCMQAKHNAKFWSWWPCSWSSQQDAEKSVDSSHYYGAAKRSSQKAWNCHTRTRDLFIFSFEHQPFLWVTPDLVLSVESRTSRWLNKQSPSKLCTHLTRLVHTMALDRYTEKAKSPPSTGLAVLVRIHTWLPTWLLFHLRTCSSFTQTVNLVLKQDWHSTEVASHLRPKALPVSFYSARTSIQVKFHMYTGI